MQHIGLFEGIGGFSLAAKCMGWETIAWCEINPFCQTVLKYYYEKADAHENIKTTDFIRYRGLCDIVTGGFPCQPYSGAGKRKGKEDERHLWPEMLRAIIEIQPSWVVGENVRGLTNWNGGMVFDEVQADLELAGYEVLPFLLPACAKDAPHRRDRIWFIAHSGSAGTWANAGRVNTPRELFQTPGRNEVEQFTKPFRESRTTANSTGNGEYRAQEPENSNRQSGEWRGRDIDHTSEVSGQNWGADAANTGYEGLQGSEDIGNITRIRENRIEQLAGLLPSNWEKFPTQPPLCSRNDGLPTELSGITFSKHRAESIKAYGNAIVPQVAFEIFKAIEKYENQKLK